MSSMKPRAVEEAVSHVAYALSDLSYVIEPVSFGTVLNEYIVSARRNVFDQVGKVESSAFGQELIERAYAASTKGQFVTLFASSPSSLLHMVPTMYKLSNALLPAVIHVVARDHSDIMAVRQTGFVVLHSLSASETEDMAVVAHVASLLTNVPFLHVFDGDLTYNELERRIGGATSKYSQSLIPYSRLAEIIGLDPTSTTEFRQRVLAQSTFSSSSSELYFEKSSQCISRFQSIPSILERVFSDVCPNKGYQLFEYHGHADAESILVVMGTSATVFRTVVESLVSQWNARVGVVSVRLFRPWSSEAFLRVIPVSVQRIAVLDRMDDVSNVGQPLYVDVLSSFESQEGPIPTVVGGQYACGTHGLEAATARVVVEGVAAGTLVNGFTVNDNSSVPDSSSASTTVATSPSFEAPYIKMLHQLFEKRAVIANLAHASTIWNDQPPHAVPALDQIVIENGEFGFGVHLGILAKRQQLQDQVKALLASPSGVSERLSLCLKEWTTTTSRPQQQAISQEILILLEQEQAHPELSALSPYFAPLSQWIVGSHAFSRDLGVSGIHQILQSGENINVLMLDTESMHGLDKTQRKRDVGLYAMQYGNAYVASVALYDSYAQVLRALSEADAFDGPSIVLCFAPDVANVEQETKEAVSSGYWPLYRYNPRLEEVEGEKAFALESPSMKQELLTFLQRHHQLSLFAQQALAPASVSTTQQYEQLEQQALEASYQALLHGFGTETVKAPWQVDTKLTIVVGSDNGRAEEFASKFRAEALGLGLVNVLKMDMNAYGMEEMEEDAQDAHAYTLFVCSTAGQGEFPSNAKECWHRVSTCTSTLPLQYGVFGLGDSHYWPREDEKHYFCKAPVDLDAKLSELGAKRCIEVAKADDQDVDGPLTLYEVWKAQWWEAIGVPIEVVTALTDSATKKPARTNEDIKRESNYLRGGLAVGLEDRSTKQLPADDTQLTKFHGIYQQDDRDLRDEMRLTNQEKAFSFMIRVRVPGGVSTAAQYLMIDQLADSHANGNIKLTTRQAYQLQGILKWNLKPIVQGINRVLMDSLAACGDVNRNVMSSVNPPCSVTLHQAIVDVACSLSTHLTPKTSAYHEIWLDKKMVAGGETKDVEPLYGETYLPRKFKIAIAVPPSNDVDVFVNCLGLIAILDHANDTLLGFNVTVGGGMGMTHNNHKTFPRLGDVLAFITPDQVNHVAEHIMVQQRDLGDRVNRKHARYKYTVEDHGLAWIRADLETRLGYTLAPPRPFTFTHNGDRFGWHKQSNGLFHYTMFIEGGRIKDTERVQLRTGLRLIAQQFAHVEFHLTANQNLSLVGIQAEEIALIKTLMETYHFGNDQYSGMRLNSIACAALPFCGLAFAEAERYLPTLITKLEDILEEHGLRDDAIVIRMTGCANGCGRPYLGEIGLVGRAPGLYNLYLGAGHAGERLNKLYQEGVDEQQILTALAPVIKAYAEYRDEKETFGDFVIRHGFVQACLAAPLVEERAAGETFHA